MSEPRVGQSVYGGFAQVLQLGPLLVEHSCGSATLVPSLLKLIGSLIEGYAMCTYSGKDICTTSISLPLQFGLFCLLWFYLGLFWAYFGLF